MSENFQGIKNPVLHATIPTMDGRWMVFAGIDGKSVILPGFLGSKEDAEAVADALNKRDMARYKDENDAKSADSFSPLSLKELAGQLGINWIDE